MTEREQELIRENNYLKNRLREAEETLRAIRNENVDTDVISLENSDKSIKAFSSSILAFIEPQTKITLQRLNTFLDGMYSGVLLMTEDAKVKFINKAFCDAYNIKESPDKLIGIGSDDFLSLIKSAFNEPDLASTRIKEIIKNGQRVRGEKIELREGKVGIRDYFPLTIDGKSKGSLWIHTDISDLKSTQEALKESEKKYRELVKYAPAFIFEIDLLKQKFLTVNDEMTIMTGYSGEELHSMNPSVIMDDESKSVYKSWTKKTTKDDSLTKSDEYKLKAKDGHIINAVLKPIFKFDEHGSPVSAVVVGHDITERKRNEDELQITLFKYKTLFDLFPLGITISDVTGNIIESNELSETILGITKEEQEQREISGNEWKVVFPDGRPMLSDAFASVIALKENRPVNNMEMGIIRSDNTISWINVCAIPIPLKEYGVIITYNDITEQKNYEEVIKKSEANLRGILEATKESIWMFNPEGVILIGNSIAFARLRMPAKDVIGKRLHDILPLELAENRSLKLRNVVETGLPIEFEDERGGYYFIHNFYPILNDTRQVIAVVSYSRDITERKMSEKKLEMTLQRFYLMLSVMNHAILLVSNEDKVEFANQAFCNVFGLKESPDELINKTAEYILERIRPSYFNPEIAINRIREIVAQEKEVIGEDIGMTSNRFYLRDFIPIRLEGKLYGRLWNHIEITEHKKAEENLHKMIRTLHAMQKSSLLMIHAIDEEKFLQDVCKIIIEDCGHTLVWIGYKQNDPEKTVKPVAFAGFEENYIKSLNISWADNERGRGPTGTAIRTGKNSLCRNMKTDPNFEPWRKEALKRGYSSSISLPLFMDKEVFGAMMIYSREQNPFSDDEQALLTKLAHDLAYGIKAIRLNLALIHARDSLEVTVEQRTALLKKTLNELEVERQRFQNVINLIPAYVALITQDHRIAFSNKNFEEYFGEIGDKKCYEVFFGRKKSCEICKAHKVLSNGLPYQWETVCKNGRTYQISDFAFIDTDGVSLILEIGVDITEKKNLENFILSKILETEENERKRLAIDLHDDLGPTLSAIKIQLSLLEKVKTSKERKELLEISYQLLSETIDKMRTVANNIMPNLIESYGLATAVESFIHKIEKTCQIKFKFKSNLKGQRFDRDTELHLYRILTELINNTIKHSGATEVVLDLNLTDKKLNIKYYDNGVGYSADNDPLTVSGIGLQNIKNRVNMVQGTIDFINKGGKTIVNITKLC